jgi:hypothetical protein
MSAFIGKRSFLLLLAVCVVTGTLWAAQDPFVGKWKLDPSKSKVIDRMKVLDLGSNKYAFNFGGGPEKIIADGTDQPAIFGSMLAVTIEGPDSLKVVRKKDGRMLLTAVWNLSQDGDTLTDNYTEYPPNTAPSTVIYHYTRTTAGSGFAGTWESTMPVNSFVLEIRSNEGSGLSFIRPPEVVLRNLKFDGKDYAAAGHAVAEGSTSARRVDEHTLEITDKVNGKITRTEKIELSPDLKRLTRSVHSVGQGDPNIFVFERQ